jgi:diguanylate cyclase (GGDEF)-like protein
VEANAGALLVLLSRIDEGLLDELHALGATHFLVSPFTEVQLIQAIRFAARHAVRAGGEREDQGSEPEDGQSWRWRPHDKEVEVGASLARRAGLPIGSRRLPLRRAVRLIGREGIGAVRGIATRLLATGEGDAFAHPDPDQKGSRVAHHLRLAADGSVVGRTESLLAAGAKDSRDPLTGVGDGRAMRAWVHEGLAGAGGADGQPLVLLLAALTRFDAINLAFGRASGDAVLQAAARRIARQADARGAGGRVARIAGAEFAILMRPPAGPADAKLLALHVMEALARPFASGDRAITIGSRIGIAVSRAGDTAAALLRRASAALAEAKGQEGAPVSLIDADAEQAHARGDRLEIDLRRALDMGEIDVLFQPQVEIASGAIVGVEALARWNHPVYGELGAGTLFAVAERSDYLVQLSDHVQRKALEEAAAWPASLGHLRVSVNVTAQDIVRPGFAAQFLKMVQESGLEPRRVTAEVTESGLIEDLPAAASLLAELRRGGLMVAIDDFGTGYSSLAYLKALPLDYLKLDKSLCADIDGSPRDQVVVRSVIDMACSLGLAVVAEGVETRAQLELLAREGCALFQGFLCAPPLPTVRLIDLVAAGQQREAAE